MSAEVSAILDKHGFAIAAMDRRIYPCERYRTLVLLEPSERAESLRECEVVGEVVFPPTTDCRFVLSLAAVIVDGEMRLVSKERLNVKAQT